ncbi:hypothetical protein ABPG74_005184 [Tetrahymena malaccensis]
MGHQWHVVQRMSQFLTTTQGRDKSCRLIQYIAMLVSSVMKQRLKYKKDGSKQYEKVLKMEKLGSTMLMTRKVLRLGKPATNLMQMIISIKKLINSQHNKPQETKFLLITKALKDFFLMSYYLCDHFVWLSKINIITKEAIAKKVETLGYCFWLAALIVIIGYEVEYLKNTAKLTQGMEWTGDEAQRKKMQQYYLEIQKCIIEILRAVFDIPVSLWHINNEWFNTTFVSILGVITSYIGCMQCWQK